MTEEEIKELVASEMKEFKDFIEMYMDVPLIAAEMNNDAKAILKAIEKNDAQWSLGKKKQKSIEDNMKKLQEMNFKLRNK